jgi:hypothetical protein
MYIGCHVKYPLFLSDFSENQLSQHIFEKSPNLKFHKNPSSGSQVVPFERTDMTKLIVAFRSIVNTPKNRHNRHKN